jgi:hypothetical protein
MSKIQILFNWIAHVIDFILKHEVATPVGRSVICYCFTPLASVELHFIQWARAETRII